MKKIIALFLILSFAGVLGCADPHRVCNNGTCDICEPYGFANKEVKCPNAVYGVSGGNVVLSVLFSETVVVPILLLGWQIFEVDCDQTLGCSE